MIGDLLPADVAGVEAYGDPSGVRLFPAEEAVISRAVEKRRREFSTVRDCARRALARLDVPAAPILPGERGAPGWPAGVVGSMTHCAGYRAAAVARADRVAAVGIDAEPDAPLPDGVLEAVAAPAERAALRRLPAGPSWDRLLFSAKETVYKAWFPATGRFLEFEEATVDIDPDGGFAARILVGGGTLAGRPLTGFRGRWAARDGLLLTTVVVPAG